MSQEIVGQASEVNFSIDSFTVRLPDRPIQINGEPYGLVLSEETLRIATGVAQLGHTRRDSPFDIRELRINSSPGLPPQLNEKARRIAPHLSVRQGILSVATVEAVTNFDSEEDLPDRVRTRLAEDILKGLCIPGYAGMIRRRHQLAIGSLYAAGVALGEGIGVYIGSPSLGHTVRDGAAGAFVGVGSALCAHIGFSQGDPFYNVKRYQRHADIARNRIESGKSPVVEKLKSLNDSIIRLEKI